MINDKYKRIVAAASFATVAVSSTLPVIAESMAGFQAGSMAGSMYDTQSSDQNSSNARSVNSSQSTNQQNSHAGTENFSQGRIESAGGPLTNSGPGYMVPNAQNNTGDKGLAGNKPGMVGSPSMTLPAPPANMKAGGEGYNSPSARGAAPLPASSAGSASAKRTTNNQISGKPAQMSSNSSRVLRHTPRIVTRTYRWSSKRR